MQVLFLLQFIQVLFSGSTFVFPNRLKAFLINITLERSTHTWHAYLSGLIEGSAASYASKAGPARWRATQHTVHTQHIVSCSSHYSFFSCFILLCLVVSFYFLLIHVPNVLLPSCVPPKPGFPWYLSHISLISTALFLVSLNLQLTPSLVGMRCSFLSAFVFGLPDLDHKTSPFVCCVACYWTNQLWDINPPSLYLTCILSL